MRIYQVYLHGDSLTDVMLNWQEALAAFQWYKEEGFKDVKIVDTMSEVQ